MQKKYCIITYGCQMNVHQSEMIAGILEKMGYEKEENEKISDVVVFDTCCIRETAEQKAMGNIGALKSVKQKNKDMVIIVCGCMTQQDGYDALMKKRFPFVDIVLGTHNIPELGDMLEEHLRTHKNVYRIDKNEKPPVVENVPIARTSYPHAWVNITYGCNNFCTYCIVPYVRGRERSRKYTEILKDINNLLAEGYKEITLLGQNVNSYGSDFDNKVDFAFLLEQIAKIEGKFRLRFMTSHPKDLNSKVVDIIASCPNMCNCIHLPVQAGSTEILQKMNRHYTREHYLETVEMIRSKIPNCALTTDIMVGFPTETEEDFLDTVDLVKRVRYSSAFTFIYNTRKGTPAEKMEQIPYEIKQRRIGELIKIQNTITKEISQEYLGTTKEVLVEGKNPKYSEDSLCGRTDSGRLVNFKGSDDKIGEFVNVKITNARSASLFGEIVE